MPEIISRKEARACGLKRYFTGKACCHGHLSERILAGHCVECNVLQGAKMRAKHPERYKEWRKNWAMRNPDKTSEKCRRYRASNLEKMRMADRERAQKRADLIAVLRVEMPELLKEFGL